MPSSIERRASRCVRGECAERFGRLQPFDAHALEQQIDALIGEGHDDLGAGR